jgi:5-methyltetrahydrofolate--homocysteine methyltransferase
MLAQIAESSSPSWRYRRSNVDKVLIGTVKGDIHDIGKNIVTFMLDVNGFEVRDLGVDVPPEKFVEAIREFQPEVVGLSGFLTLALTP